MEENYVTFLKKIEIVIIVFFLLISEVHNLFVLNQFLCIWW